MKILKKTTRKLENTKNLKATLTNLQGWTSSDAATEVVPLDTGDAL